MTLTAAPSNPAPDERLEVFARKGSRLSNENARLFWEATKDLDPDERTPERILEIAKDPSSPIHGLYNWNIQEAAEEHWLAQTRTYVRSVVVRVVKSERKVISAPVFHRAPVTEDADKPVTKRRLSYVTIDEAQQDAAKVQYILRTSRNELRAFANKVITEEALFLEHDPRLVDVARLAEQVLAEEREEVAEE